MQRHKVAVSRRTRAAGRGPRPAVASSRRNTYRSWIAVTVWILAGLVVIAFTAAIIATP